MFNIGDYVVFGSDGVCKIADIGSIDMEGISKEKQYYTLVPVAHNGGKIFAPVDSKKKKMRHIIDEKQAYELIDSFKSPEAIEIVDEKRREDKYKDIVFRCDCNELVSLIMEIRNRRISRNEMGKKLPAVDEKYLTIAENCLYNELSLPLKMEKGMVKEYIESKVGFAI